MGLHDREYYRESADAEGNWFGSRTICQILLLVTCGVFVLQLLSSQGGEAGGFGAWLQFRVDEVFRRGQVWRLVTYAFVHSLGQLTHIVFNMLGLYYFGPDLEAIYGRREFLRFYLIAAVCGALCHTALVLALGTDLRVPMIGASGAVLGVLMLYARHFPRRQVYLMGLIPLEIRWLVLAYVVLDFFPIVSQLLNGSSRGDTVAHAAHLGGLLYGFLFHRFNLPLTLWAPFDALFRRGGSSSATSRPDSRGGVGRRRADVRLHRPDVESRPTLTEFESAEVGQPDFQEQVDQILAKIFEQGEGSLTSSERRILEEASERYKKRR